MRRTPEEIYRIDRTGEGDGDAPSIPALNCRELVAKDRDSGVILFGRGQPDREEVRASPEEDARCCGASAAEERARARDQRRAECLLQVADRVGRCWPEDS